MSHGIATKSWKMIDFAHFEGLKNLARGRALLARVRVFWQRARKCVAVQFAALLVRLEWQRRKRAGQLVAVEPQVSGLCENCFGRMSAPSFPSSVAAPKSSYSQR